LSGNPDRDAEAGEFNFRLHAKRLIEPAPAAGFAVRLFSTARSLRQWYPHGHVGHAAVGPGVIGDEAYAGGVGRFRPEVLAHLEFGILSAKPATHLETDLDDVAMENGAMA